jgi:hypothetical protein
LVTLPGTILDSDSDAFSIGDDSTTLPLTPLVFRPTQLGRQHLLVKDLSRSSSVPAPGSVLLAVGEGVAGPCAIPDAGP